MALMLFVTFGILYCMLWVSLHKERHCIVFKVTCTPSVQSTMFAAVILTLTFGQLYNPGILVAVCIQGLYVIMKSGLIHLVVRYFLGQTFGCKLNHFQGIYPTALVILAALAQSCTESTPQRVNLPRLKITQWPDKINREENAKSPGIDMSDQHGDAVNETGHANSDPESSIFLDLKQGQVQGWNRVFRWR